MQTSIKWKNEYSIGVADIDSQHQKLFKLLNMLEDSLANGLESTIGGAIIKELVNYTQTHFKEEEKLMEEIHYADIEKHRSLHRNLILEVKGILVRLKKGKNYSTDDLLKFLNHWLIDHIGEEDKKVGMAFSEYKRMHHEKITS